MPHPRNPPLNPTAGSDVRPDHRHSNHSVGKIFLHDLIPGIKDGLLPVQRRNLYALSEIGLCATKPPNTFDRIAAILGVDVEQNSDEEYDFFEGLLCMARPWVARYPLLATEGDTEYPGHTPSEYGPILCRLTPLGQAMFDDLHPDIVSFVHGHGGRAPGPAFLPAQLPMLLLNGTLRSEASIDEDAEGDADSAASNRPDSECLPHNLGEVVDAVCAVISNPGVSIDEIAQIIIGPDFPTGGSVLADDGLRSYLRTGCGRLTVRGRIEVRGREIIVVEVSFGVETGYFVGDLCEKMCNGGIVGARDIRDLSYGKAPRAAIVMSLKPDVTAASVISQLYEKTLLTTHIDVEMRCMVDGAPRVMNIKRLIDAFISYRCQVVSLRSARRVRRMDTPEEHLRNLPKSGADVVRVVKEELLALRGVYETKRRTDIVAV